ncbi:hypothetical protein Tco_1521528 [Tanacetum coccineum]
MLPGQIGSMLLSPQHGKPQLDDKGFVDSGCSRHMTGNIAYLSDFKQFNGGYVAFGGVNAVRLKLVLPVFVSAVKRMLMLPVQVFAVQTVNGMRQLQALVDKKRVIVKESSIRRDLHLDDAEGTYCLPTATIFEELARMGYEKPSQKLTFYKDFFSP